MRPSLYRVSLCPISFSASQLLFCQFNFTRLTLSFIKFRQINICNINIINTIILSINIQYYSEVLDRAGGGGAFHCILGLETKFHKMLTAKTCYCLSYEYCYKCFNCCYCPEYRCCNSPFSCNLACIMQSVIKLLFTRQKQCGCFTLQQNCL